MRLAAALLLLALSHPALAQYPNRAVKLVVPFPPAGATDIVGRIVAQKLGEQMGQSVVVENKPGAGGSIGSDLVAKSAPDGYTLLMATSSTHSIGPALQKPAASEAAAKPASLAQAFLSTLGLTLANPPTILAFAAIFAGLGLAASADYRAAALVTLAVFLGSASWWVVLAFAGGALRERLGARLLRAINLVSGLTILGFAAWQFAQLLR